jgi:hypothetical protein
MTIDVSIRSFEEVPAKDGGDNHIDYQIMVSVVSHDNNQTNHATPPDILNSWTVGVLVAT